MQQADAERLRLVRLRWRLRGAWQWPTFTIAVVADCVLVHLLPISGSATGLVPALLLAGFANLVAVAVLAPLAAIPLRRARRDLPRVIARDYAGTALIVLVAALLALLGALHHPAVVAHRRDVVALSTAVRAYVDQHADASHRQRLARADTLQLDARLYRTCVPGGAGEPALCLVVDTSTSPPGLRVDPSHAPNTTLGHPFG
jgi:hypothetical protein